MNDAKNNRPFVYSPRLYYVITLLVAIPGFLFLFGCSMAFYFLRKPVPDGFISYYDYSSFILTMAMGPVLFIIAVVVILLLGWPKKLYLDDNGLAIKKILVFWEKEKTMSYAEMADVEMIVARSRYLVVLLVINLKNGKKIKLDFGLSEKYKQFLEQLKERIAGQSA